MIEIYHNPRCRKSREALQLLETKNIEHKVILYLNTAPGKLELVSILKKLGIAPLDLIRKQETIWKSNFKNKNLSDDEVIEAMVAYRILIERPIITNNEKAVIGRPLEKILTLLQIT